MYDENGGLVCGWVCDFCDQAISRFAQFVPQSIPVCIEPLRGKVGGGACVFIMCFLLVRTDIHWITLSKHVHIVTLWVFGTIWRSIQRPGCSQKQQLWMRKLQQWFPFKLVISVSIFKNYHLKVCLSFLATVLDNETVCLWNYRTQFSNVTHKSKIVKVMASFTI